MKTLTINTSKPCTIRINRGIIQENFSKGFIITDENIKQRYNHLLNRPHYVILAGEVGKSFDEYKKILEALGNEKTIIALGGGVVGDIAGFVAATYKRGMGLIQIPTTLLAMVDSSIGGKNGINIGQKKNQAGTIYQPKEVLIDPNFLETLPLEEFQNGLAEVIKYAYLFDSPRRSTPINEMAQTDERIEEILCDCIKNKASIVEEDEFDKGSRFALNFGHTIGHAIELSHNLKHGHAVSIGMAKEVEIAISKEIATENNREFLIRALESNGLPTKLPEGHNIEEIIKLMKSDKKGEFVFALNKENFRVKLTEGEVRNIL